MDAALLVLLVVLAAAAIVVVARRRAAAEWDRLAAERELVAIEWQTLHQTQRVREAYYSAREAIRDVQHGS